MSKLRVGKLFRLAGADYETLIDVSLSPDEKEVVLFANRIRGTFLAQALGRLIDPGWYEQNKKDIEQLTRDNLQKD